MSRLVIEFTREDALVLFEASRSLATGSMAVGPDADCSFGPAHAMETKRSEDLRALLVRLLPDLALFVGAKS